MSGLGQSSELKPQYWKGKGKKEGKGKEKRKGKEKKRMKRKGRKKNCFITDCSITEYSKIFQL
jgi:hypothetical protein